MVTFISGGVRDGLWSDGYGNYYATRAQAEAGAAQRSGSGSSIGGIYGMASSGGGRTSSASSSSKSSWTNITAPSATAGLATAATIDAAPGSAQYNAAVAQAKQGLPAAQQAFDIALDAYNGPIRNQYQRINQYAQDAWGSARSMDAAISGAYGTAGTLAGQGQTIWGQGLDLFAVGQSLLNGTADSSTIYGAYLDAVRAIDPNRYVSMAASDVQAQAENARGQLERQLARQGMSASATAASLQNWAQNLAVATASAKTLARQKGISERKDALAELNQYAANIAKLAVDMQSQGVAATKASGDMYAQAGQLGASQSRAFTDAGQMANSASNLLIDGLNAVNSAAGRVVDANQILANIQASYGRDLFGIAEAQAQLKTQASIQNAQLKTQVSVANANNALRAAEANANNALSWATTNAKTAASKALRGATVKTVKAGGNAGKIPIESAQYQLKKVAPW